MNTSDRKLNVNLDHGSPLWGAEALPTVVAHLPLPFTVGRAEPAAPATALQAEAKCAVSRAKQQRARAQLSSPAWDPGNLLLQMAGLQDARGLDLESPHGKELPWGGTRPVLHFV